MVWRGKMIPPRENMAMQVVFSFNSDESGHEACHLVELVAPQCDSPAPYCDGTSETGPFVYGLAPRDEGEEEEDFEEDDEWDEDDEDLDDDDDEDYDDDDEYDEEDEDDWDEDDEDEDDWDDEEDEEDAE
jgi:hypothetical protein